MTPQTLQQLQEIMADDPWKREGRIRALMASVEVIEEAKGKRTPAQNDALHLWFTQIAKLCRDAGIDAPLIMSQVMHYDVDMYFIKGMWKKLQKALFHTESTRELQKTGHIDKMVDHFVRFFGENEKLKHLELPPFPHDPNKQKSDLLEGMKIDVRNDEEYPELTAMPTF